MDVRTEDRRNEPAHGAAPAQVPSAQSQPFLEPPGASEATLLIVDDTATNLTLLREHVGSAEPAAAT